MDPQTEQLVLKTIDEIFEDRTTITIAHRLDVVIKGSRILVMEQGEAMELVSTTSCQVECHLPQSLLQPSPVPFVSTAPSILKTRLRYL